MNQLKKLLEPISQNDYPQESRVHQLKSMEGFVKRDDELGFGISGSKVRKYRSLIPELKKYQEVFIIGGPNSNHVAGILQLLIENDIFYRLFLREGYGDGINGKLIKLFTSDTSISIISRNDWDRVEEIAAKMAKPKTFVLPEGGAIKESLPGALSLPLDILRNEKDLGFEFDHIFIDAGTGLSAIGLILGFAYLVKKTKVHVLLLAASEKEFTDRLMAFHGEFQTMFEVSCPIPQNFHLHPPTNAKSFGSTNQTLFNEIQAIAKNEGFLVDPIYSAKLFYESKKLTPRLQGTKLIIHSGGAASLFGYKINPQS